MISGITLIGGVNQDSLFSKTLDFDSKERGAVPLPGRRFVKAME